MEVTNECAAEYRDYTTNFGNSIGCFVPAKCIISVAVSTADSSISHYYINQDKLLMLAHDLLEGLNKPVNKDETPKQPYTLAEPYEDDTPKFMDDMVVGTGTGFYIGNALVATAGHCVFASDGSGRPDLDVVSGYFITNFTQGLDDGNKKIDKRNVFAIKKVLFGQNELFDIKPGVRSDTHDRPDWAVIKIAPLYPGQPWPDALTIRRPTYQKRQTLKGGGISIIGHPWGTTLKEARPGDSALLSPFNSNIQRPIPYQNSWRHNIRTNHGSSGSPVFHEVDKVTEVVGIAASIRTADPLLNSGFELSKRNPESCKIVPYQDNSAILYNATNNETWYAMGHRTDVSLFVICRPNKALPFTAGKLTVRFVLLDQTGLDPLTGDFSAKKKELEVNTDPIILTLAKTGENAIEFASFQLPNSTNNGVGPWDTIRAELTYETPADTRWAATLSLDYLCIGYCFTPPGITVDKGSIVAETGVVLFRYSTADQQGRDPIKFQAVKRGQTPIVHQLSLGQLLPADMKEKLAGDMSVIN